MDITVQAARENFLYLTLIAAGIGLLLGLVPLVFALRKGKTGLGLLANLICTVLGAVQPLLALLAAGIFTWVVLRKGSPGKPGEAAPTSDSTQPE